MKPVFTRKVETDSIKKALSELIDQTGGIEKFVSRGDRVLLKPNFNTADPYPASSDPSFIKAVVELVLKAEPASVTIGDSSTIMLNTEKVLSDLKIRDLESIDPRVKVMNFRTEPWVNKTVPNGKYLKSVKIPAELDRTDALILLPCLKTHRMTQFTGSLKLAVGFIHPLQRINLHLSHLQEKVAEVNTLLNPRLIIMDGRKCFITRGPESGEVQEPGILLASESRVAIDIEGIRIIQTFPGNDLSRTTADDLPQIRLAKELID